MFVCVQIHDNFDITDNAVESGEFGSRGGACTGAESDAKAMLERPVNGDGGDEQDWWDFLDVGCL